MSERGDEFKTNKFGIAILWEIIHSRAWKVQFKNTGHIDTFRPSDVRSGSIKDYWAPSLYGVGIIHSRELAHANKEAFTHWKQLIKRTSDLVWKKDNPTYDDVKVDPTWHNFKTFLLWYDRQTSSKDHVLDKDIFSPSVKTYRPRNCFMIPKDLNLFFSVNTAKKKEKGAHVGVHKVGRGWVVRINGFNVVYPTSTGGITGSYVGTYPTLKDAIAVYMFYRTHMAAKILSPNRLKVSKSFLKRFDALMKFQRKKFGPRALKAIGVKAS